MLNLQKLMKVLFVAVLLVAAGCRMYGDADSARLLEDGIVQEAAALAKARDGVQVNAAVLEVLASEDEALAPFAARLTAVANDFASLVVSHQAVAEVIQEDVSVLRSNPLARWVGSDRYRSLHRTYGAMIAEKRVLMDRYEAVRADLQALAASSGQLVVREVGRYQIAPQFYHQLEYNAQRQELSDILANMGAEP